MSRHSNSRLKGKSRQQLVELAAVNVLAFDSHGYKHAGRCDVAGCDSWTRGAVRVYDQARGVHCCEQCREAIATLVAMQAAGGAR